MFTRLFLLRVWYPLAMAILFGGCALSLHYFPGPFDWRYRVVSSATSQIDNPGGNKYLCAAIAIVGLMLLPLCRYIYVRLATAAPRTAIFSFFALRIGLLAAVVVGIERLVFRNLSAQIHKIHEYIALVSFSGLFMGVVGFWLALSWQLQGRRPMPHWKLGVMFLVTAGPMIGAALSQAYLYFFPNHLGWVGPHWAELGVPLYLSFAFWEWIASVAVFAYLYLIVWFAPEPAATSRKKVLKAPRKAS